MTTPPRPAGPPPDAATLHRAALAYLARYAATKVALRRTLDRKLERWGRAAEAELGAEAVASHLAAARKVVNEVVARLAAAGAVDDATFAAGRAGRLIRAGRSRRAVIAHLVGKGVAGETAAAALPADPETELVAALVLARRRRIGPFRPSKHPDRAEARRELGILARAGFARAVATRALRLDREEAEARVSRLRRD